MAYHLDHHRIVRYRELRAKYNKLKRETERLKCYKIVKTGQTNIEGITTFVNHFGFDAEKCRSFAYKVYDKARYEKKKFFMTFQLILKRRPK